MQRALPYIQFCAPAEAASRQRVEDLVGQSGPYRPPQGRSWVRRAAIRGLNTLFWRQQIWNREMAQILVAPWARPHDALSPNREKPKLLILVPHNIVDPSTGGAARMRGLCQGLAPFFDLTLLTLVGRKGRWDRQWLSPDVALLLCPWSKQLGEEVTRRRSRYGRAAAFLTMGDPDVPFPLLDAYLRHTGPDLAAILMVGPYLYERTRRNVPETPIVYDMHDVNADFLGQMAGPFREAAVEALRCIEEPLLNDAVLTTVVSQADERRLRELYPKCEFQTHFAPNGVSVRDAVKVNPQESLRLAQDFGVGEAGIVFIGSNLEANQQAARFVRDTLAPAFPRVRWIIVGEAGRPLLMEQKQHSLPENLVLTGAVSSFQKEAILALCSIAVAPMAEGTGSSLKIPDYIAHGKCVVTTPMGLRGHESLEASVCVASLNGFADAIDRVLARLEQEPVALDRQAEHAWDAVRNDLDWGGIGQDLTTRLLPLLHASPEIRNVASVLD